MKKYYNLNVQENTADLYIFGDITFSGWEWEGDYSPSMLLKELKELPENISEINVHINSYGGAVSEGLAIYNILKAQNANVVTVCDGFACSAASLIFMAGDTRIMNEASLMFIHGTQGGAFGSAEDLAKEAETMAKMNTVIKNIYMNYFTGEETDLETMLKEEHWFTPDEAVANGLATSIAESPKQENTYTNVMPFFMNFIENQKKQNKQASTDTAHEQLFDERLKSLEKDFENFKENLAVFNKQTKSEKHSNKYFKRGN